MLFSSFAHRLLLAFGLFVFATLAVLAAKFGWLGEPAHTLLDAIWIPLQRFYEERKDIINAAFRWIGFLGTVLGAAFAVHKGWHYAEISLPARLEDLNSRWRDRIVRSRIGIIPALSEIATIQAPPIEVPSPGLFGRLILPFYDPMQRALAKGEKERSKYELDLGVLIGSKERCQAEVATAYLVWGSTLARCLPDRSRDALAAFKKALELNDKDLDALELTAKQEFALGFDQPALDYLDAMGTVASELNDQPRHARALRFQAEILHGSEKSADWDRAREKLVAVVASLRRTDGLEPHKRNCELALAHEILADVQITREKFTAARTELNQAVVLFHRIPPPCGPEGLERLRDLSKRLDQAAKDKDNPDVPD